MVTPTLFLASLFMFALDHPLTRRTMTVHETQVLPEGFTSRGAAFSDTMLNLRLALTQTDPDGMIQSLMDISTPGNALYGRQFTKEEVQNHSQTNVLHAYQLWKFPGCSLRGAEARDGASCSNLVKRE